MRQRGFTLIEVMVALVVTGLVVSIAYASLQAGFATSERLIATQGGEEREVVARALLSRAIRHALPGTIGGQPVFLLRTGPSGDDLTFRTRGVSDPAGASEVWEVDVTRVAGGIRISGRAVDDDARTFSSVLPRVDQIDVRVRGRGFGDGWFETWDFPDRSPVAVTIAFLNAEGRPIGSPLIARVGFEGNP